MHQSWRDLLFVHSQVPADLLQQALPSRVFVDTFELEPGLPTAWIGTATFTMHGIRPIGLPGVPWLSAFAETNLRTYVHVDGVPGIWFFSLDATRRLACEAARLSYGLPYLHADIQTAHTELGFHYALRRLDDPPAELIADYSPLAKPQLAEPNTFDYWLVERYLLFAERRGQLLRASVQHPPYAIQPVALRRFDSNLAESLGLPSGSVDHVCYCPGVDVEVWAPELVD